MASKRMAWLDWQRGLAVLFMIEVHVLGGWTAPEAAHGWLYDVLRLIGGFAAPGFLYMAGLSLVLADEAQAARGVPARERRRQHLVRALYLLGVAYAFRVAEYLLGAGFWVEDGWLGIFRVDVLNIIAVALALVALVTVGLERRWRLGASAAAAGLVVAVTPIVAARPWDSLAWGYVFMPGGSGFGACNWTAFALAGGFVGTLLAARPWPGLVLALGAGLAALGLGIDRLPPLYALQGFWAVSPAWFLMRLGITVALSGALMLLPQTLRGLTWLTKLGRHSLFAYMASVELTYGLLFKRWHGRLELGPMVASVVGVTLATLALIQALEWPSARRLRTRDSAGAR